MQPSKNTWVWRTRCKNTRFFHTTSKKLRKHHNLFSRLTNDSLYFLAQYSSRFQRKLFLTGMQNSITFVYICQHTPTTPTQRANSEICDAEDGKRVLHTQNLLKFQQDFEKTVLRFRVLFTSWWGLREIARLFANLRQKLQEAAVGTMNGALSF
jgi:hypothetical protein